MAFIQSTRQNPMLAHSKINKIQKTFVKFKNVPYGEWQINQAVYRIKKKNGILYNLLFIGNPYKIGLAEYKNDGIKEELKSKKGILLQSNTDDLFFVINDEGRNTKISKTWATLEIRTLLHYVPKLNSLLDINEENEILFNIDDNKQSFMAIGLGIDGVMFEGYKLQYVKKLHNNIITEQNTQTVETKTNFQDINLDDLV
mgnify:CR=1 FL=1